MQRSADSVGVVLVSRARRSWMAARMVVSAIAVVTMAGCADLGFRDRVLWRVASPDGRVVAVCQEVPALDGPGYELRLERPDGSHVRPLRAFGDADGCSELVWSPDGRMLAMLTAHVARVHYVALSSTLVNPAAAASEPGGAGATRGSDGGALHWRQVDLSSEQRAARGRALRFTRPDEIAVDVCREAGPTPRSGPAPSGTACATSWTVMRIALNDAERSVAAAPARGVGAGRSALGARL